MGDLADIIDISITRTTVVPSAESFDVAMLLAYHTKWTERSRSYTDLLGLVADGFATTDAVYRAALAFFSQNPHPRTLKVGRRALAPSQVIDIYPQSGKVSTGTTYSGTINGVPWTYTQGGTQTVAAAVTGIAAAIDALSGVTAAGVASTHAHVTLDAAGDVRDFVFNQDEQYYKILDVTADPGIATDLANIALEDNAWYAGALDSESPAEVLAAAAWFETQKKILLHSIADSQTFDATVTNDAPSTMKAASRTRTAGIFNAERIDGTYPSLAWIGNRLVADPGSDTWAFKTLAGVIPDSLSATKQSAIEGKNVNHYQTIAGVSITRKGIVYSGEFLDVIRGSDWLQARIAERVYGLLVSNPKLPFTDKGIDLVRSEIFAQLEAGVKVGFLVAGSLVVDAPKAKDVSPSDKAARILPDITFSAELAGAIHSVTIRGTLSI